MKTSSTMHHVGRLVGGKKSVAAAATLIFSTLAGCGPPGPEEVAKAFVSNLHYTTRAPATSELFELLDSDSRELLVRHAAVASSGIAQEIQPWELIRVVGYQEGEQYKGLRQVDASDGRIVFAWEVKSILGTRGSAEPSQVEPAKLTLVEEDGQWRVSLPSLASGQ